MKHKKIILGTTFIWIGFVCAISFMEAWLKFRAPGITTELGVGIGQLVFKALNKVELCFATLFLILIITQKENRKALMSLSLYFVFGIVLLQTLWLLPALNNRATLIIHQGKAPESMLHLWFVGLEVLKVISLGIYGMKLLNLKPLHSEIN